MITPLFQKIDDIFKKRDFEKAVVAYEPFGPRLFYGQDLRQDCLKVLGVLNNVASNNVVIFYKKSYPFLVVLIAALLARKRIILPQVLKSKFLDEIEYKGPVFSDDKTLGDKFDVIDVEALALEGERDINAVFKNVQAYDAKKAQVCFFTSGSTGKAKAIIKSIDDFEKEIRVLDGLWGEKIAGRHLISTVTHQHVYGFIFRLIWPLLRGDAFPNETSFFLEDVSKDVGKKSLLISSPAHLSRLWAFVPDISKPDILKHKGFTGVDLKGGATHGLVFCSGGALEPTAFSALVKTYDFDLYEVYGSTETGGIGYRKRTKSIGADWHCLPTVDVKGSDDGRLCLKSSWGTNGLWQQGDDRIALNAQGGFSLLGRADRIIKLEGTRVSLVRLEQHVKQSPYVVEASFLLLPSGVQKILGAVVVLTQKGQKFKAEQGRQHLIKRLKKELLAFHPLSVLPKRFRFVDDLPTNSMGKKTFSILEALFKKPYGQVENVQSLEKSKGKRQFEALQEQQDVGAKALKPPLTPAQYARLRNQGLSRQEMKISISLLKTQIWFLGHFEGQPILPGVMQVHWAVYCAGLLWPSLKGIDDIRQLKFKKIIVPPCTIELILKPKGEKDILFYYQGDGEEYSKGIIGY